MEPSPGLENSLGGLGSERLAAALMNGPEKLIRSHWFDGNGRSAYVRVE